MNVKSGGIVPIRDYLGDTNSQSTKILLKY